MFHAPGVKGKSDEFVAPVMNASPLASTVIAST